MPASLVGKSRGTEGPIPQQIFSIRKEYEEKHRIFQGNTGINAGIGVAAYRLSHECR
jgi:hypothetical protein